MRKMCDLILPGNYGQRPCSGNNFIKGKARKEWCLSKTPFLTFVCTWKWNIWVNCSQNVRLYILWHSDIWLLCDKKFCCYVNGIADRFEHLWDKTENEIMKIRVTENQVRIDTVHMNRRQREKSRNLQHRMTKIWKKNH